MGRELNDNISLTPVLNCSVTDRQTDRQTIHKPFHM